MLSNKKISDLEKPINEEIILLECCMGHQAVGLDPLKRPADEQTVREAYNLAKP